MVHRPRYDDWTFPKGKLDDGERHETGALREVAEETGLRCRLGAELADVRYLDDPRVQEAVRYWAMTALGRRFVPAQRRGRRDPLGAPTRPPSS